MVRRKQNGKSGRNIKKALIFLLMRMGRRVIFCGGKPSTNQPTSQHGVIILNRSNNSQISIETSTLQQAGGFIIKYYFQISNITACR